jgi:hypothetical protein
MRTEVGMTQDQTHPPVTAEDRWAISDTLARYCIALDDRRFEDLEQSFQAGVVWDYGDFGAGAGLDDLRDMIRTALAPIGATHHCMGATQAATPTADGVVVRSYISAQHVRLGAPAGHLFMVAGWYFDDLVRTGDGWRIAQRRYENAWLDGNPGVFTP